MEDLEVTDEKPPNIVNQSIVETKLYHNEWSNSYNIKSVKEKYSNGVSRCTEKDGYGNYAGWKVYFEQCLEEGDLLEYRKWDDQGRKDINHFAKKIGDKEIGDGPYLSWNNDGEIRYSSYYENGEKIFSHSYEWSGGRKSVLIDGDFEETLNEYSDGSWRYSIYYKGS